MNRRASRILTVCAGVWLLVIWGQSCMPAAHSGAESGTLLTLLIFRLCRKQPKA